MEFSEWVRPYVEPQLRRLGGVRISDDAAREITITGRRELGATDPQDVTITIHLGRKVAEELKADIRDGNTVGQDLIGNHIAKKIAQHLPKGGGMETFSIGIHID